MDNLRLGCAFCKILLHKLFKVITCSKPEPPRPARHVISIGLSKSGKSTALALLAGEPLDGIEPTTGFHIKDIQLDRCILTVKELGGSDKIRKYWSHYFSHQQGIIFVVDGRGDPADLELSRQVMMSAIDHPVLEGLPVLILVTHQDHETSKSAAEISHLWNLEQCDHRRFIIHSTSINDINKLKIAFNELADILLDEASPSQILLNSG